MMNRGLKAFFWLGVLVLTYKIKYEFMFYFVCEDLNHFNGTLPSLLLYVMVFLSAFKFFSVFLKGNRGRDPRVVMAILILLSFIFFSSTLDKKIQVESLKVNSGVIISGVIIKKKPTKKSNSILRVNFNYKNESKTKSLRVNKQDYKSKQVGDTVLLLFSPTCKSTSIGYDLYPSKADVEKCWKGCDYVYGQK
jgi:hypothetical protein